MESGPSVWRRSRKPNSLRQRALGLVLILNSVLLFLGLLGLFSWRSHVQMAKVQAARAIHRWNANADSPMSEVSRQIEEYAQKFAITKPAAK